LPANGSDKNNLASNLLTNGSDKNNLASNLLTNASDKNNLASNLLTNASDKNNLASNLLTNASDKNNLASNLLTNGSKKDYLGTDLEPLAPLFLGRSGGRAVLVPHHGHPEEKGVLEEDLGRLELLMGQAASFELKPLPVDELVDRDRAGHRFELAPAHRFFRKVDELKRDAPLLEEADCLLSVAVLGRAENLDHGTYRSREPRRWQGERSMGWERGNRPRRIMLCYLSPLYSLLFALIRPIHVPTRLPGRRP
jgi:hypothetical protein